MRKNKITIAAYYFPNWHADPLNEAVHGKGWTEWEVVKCARPRFEGHRQPKIPLWGYEDESLPSVMEKKIDAARNHGIDAFVFDWYYSNEGSFREKVLNEAFLRAKNLDDMKFAVMWCNHARQGLHPAAYTQNIETFSEAGVTPENFEKMTDHIVRDYFLHPNYWTLGGKPLFAILRIDGMFRNFGSVEAVASALERFREKAAAAGLPGIHLHVMYINLLGIQKRLEGRDPLPADDPLASWGRKHDFKEILDLLKIDSCGPYGWGEHFYEPDFPVRNSANIRRAHYDFWNREADSFPVDYYPNIQMGWDSSPRTIQSDMYEPRGTTFSAVWHQTPAEYREALTEARRFLERRPENRRILFLNAWNEWTEGAYLEPDTVHGYGYLEAIRDVFNRV